MDIVKQSKIAVLCGGISNEREISLRSGKNVFEALIRKGYENTTLVDIKSAQDVFHLKSDIVFLVTHGKYGEDGCLQGILEWMKIPYTGSSVLASSLAMDKWLTKQILKSNDISTPESFLITKNNLKNLDLRKIWEMLSSKNKAIFLKPKDDGSSVNTFKIKSLADFEAKLQLIDLSQSSYLVEEYIKGREITMSVLQSNENLMVLPALELKPKNEFYDYEAKYTKGMTEFILPAPLDEKTKTRIENETIKAFTLIGCSSCARVDFILDDSNIPYVLEVNSLPGMTDTSDLPAQAQCVGIEYDDLVEIILKSARLH